METRSKSSALAAKLIYQTLVVLKEKGGELSGRQVMEEIEKRLQFSDWEAERYAKTGNIRWQTVLHFMTLGCIKAGFLIKDRGTWRITKDGESAIDLGEGQLLHSTNLAYKKWKSEQSANEESNKILADEIPSDEEMESEIESQMISEDQDFFQKVGIPRAKIWVIAAGEDGLKWEDFKNQGIIAIGWSKLGDLEKYTSELDIEAAIKTHYRDGTKSSRPINDTRTCYDFAHSVTIGDIVVAKKGQSTILGIGKVTSGYQFSSDADSGLHSMRAVSWIKTGNWTLPENARVPIKTLTDVTDYSDFTKYISTLFPAEIFNRTQLSKPTNFNGLTSESFQILDAFRSNPVVACYTARRAEFERHLAKPMALLIKDLTPIVDDVFGGEVETQKNLTSRIRKNDYGRGGIHYHYWMAFSPKGIKRSSGTQLFVYIHPDHVATGFATGTNAQVFLERLQAALKETDFDFASYFDYLSSAGYHIGSFDESGRRESKTFKCSAEEVTRLLGENSRLVIERVWPRDRAISMGASLAEQIKDTIRDTITIFALASFEDYEQYLPDPESASDLDDGSNGKLTDLSSTPSLTTDEGWTHLKKEMNWSKDSEEYSLLNSILNRSLINDDNASKQIILVGPPGTGKTKLAKQLAEGLASNSDNIAMVQFHQSYSYEDFIEGIRPRVIQGQMTYQEVAGPFVEFCRKASRPAFRDGRFVFIIDEINRGNVSRIFGELLYLLEYRQESLPLLYSKSQFSIPSNVFIIATMNCADRSLALVDYALRRRFRFIDLNPSSDVLRSWYESESHEHRIAMCFFETLNAKLPDPRLRVGHSYFLDITKRSIGLDKKTMQEIWNSAVKPLLQEYFAATPHRMSDYDFGALWKEAAESLEEGAFDEPSKESA